LNIPPPNWLRPVGPKLKYALNSKNFDVQIGIIKNSENQEENR
jgi:hypothetical protein